MADPTKPDLEERVARLEAAVEQLLSVTATPRATPRPSQPLSQSSQPSLAAERPGPEALSAASGTASATRTPGASSSVVGGERWLSRVGVGFVVLAVAFLLKLSFDRGWITPGVRLGAGLAIGFGLLAIGLRLEATRQRLAQALLGGAIALFYLVGFAGYQLYALIPLWMALALMSTTTILAFVLAERQESPALAVIGVVGGLATPFLLETGLTNPSGLALYVSLVLIGGGGVQFHRGWLSLLGVVVVGGAIALVPFGFLDAGEAVLLPLVAVAMYWTVTTVSCMARPVLRAQEPANLHLDAVLWVIRLVVLFSSLLAVGLVAVVLRLDLAGTGLLFGALALLAGMTSWQVRGTLLSQWPSAELAALCLAFAFILVSQDQAAMFLGVAEAAVLFVLVQGGAPQSLRTLGHLFVTVAIVAFCMFAVNAPIHPDSFFREGAFVRLTVLALVAVCGLVVEPDAAPIYKGAAYVGLLVWLLSELAPQAHGAALVSIAWGVQGAAALLVSLATGSRPLQLGGLTTLGLVAAKLIVVDLSQLDAVWRILMFLGFGAVLLGLAYVMNRPSSRGGNHGGAVSG